MSKELEKLKAYITSRKQEVKEILTALRENGDIDQNYYRLDGEVMAYIDCLDKIEELEGKA